jgi:hypothetical protein
VGSVLSPILFIIYVNDLPVNQINKSSVSQFADDLGLWATDKNAKRVRIRLQASLKELEAWCSKWHIKLNAAKTEFILFTRQVPKIDNLTLYGKVIPRVHKVTLLGVILDSRMTLKDHVNNTLSKAKVKLNLIYRLGGTGWGANKHTILKLYKSYVRPSLEYGSILLADWPSNSLKSIQILQNKVLRFAMRLPKKTKIAKLHELAGIEPIKERFQKLQEKALLRYGDSVLMQELIQEQILLD